MRATAERQLTRETYLKNATKEQLDIYATWEEWERRCPENPHIKLKGVARLMPDEKAMYAKGFKVLIETTAPGVDWQLDWTDEETARRQSITERRTTESQPPAEASRREPPNGGPAQKKQRVDDGPETSVGAVPAGPAQLVEPQGPPQVFGHKRQWSQENTSQPK